MAVAGSEGQSPNGCEALTTLGGLARDITTSIPLDGQQQLATTHLPPEKFFLRTCC